jgi:hypothetical protein
MLSPWGRPRLSLVGSEHRIANLSDLFRRFARRRVPRSFAAFVVGALMIGALALMQSAQPQPSSLGAMNVYANGHSRDTAFENCDAARADGAAPVLERSRRRLGPPAWPRMRGR